MGLAVGLRSKYGPTLGTRCGLWRASHYGGLRPRASRSLRRTLRSKPRSRRVAGSAISASRASRSPGSLGESGSARAVGSVPRRGEPVLAGLATGHEGRADQGPGRERRPPHGSRGPGRSRSLDPPIGSTAVGLAGQGAAEEDDGGGDRIQAGFPALDRGDSALGHFHQLRHLPLAEPATGAEPPCLAGERRAELDDPLLGFGQAEELGHGSLDGTGGVEGGEAFGSHGPVPQGSWERVVIRLRIPPDRGRP